MTTTATVPARTHRIHPAWWVAAVTFLAVWFFAGTVPDLKGFLSLILAVPAAMIAWYG